jgi:AraC-like DNA-binding protein
MVTGTKRRKKNWSDKVDGLRADIQRERPFGRLTPRQVYPLAIEQVRPVIRIAHRLDGPMRIPERIIFDHELVLFLAGQGTFSLGTKKRSYAPHDLFCVPPFVPHSIVADSVTEHIAVHFDWTLGLPVTGLLTDRKPYEVRLPAGLSLPRHTTLVAGDRVEEELKQLVVAWQTRGPLGTLTATGSLMRVLAALLRQGTTMPATGELGRVRARMESAMALLRDPSAPTQPPVLLAQAADLSVSHFNRLFREWTGFTPMEYQRRNKIAHARLLLGDARLSIKEIAARCGFDDQYHFSRVFRQLDGLSPSQYREAVLASRSR